jgi:hypothetical protein
MPHVPRNNTSTDRDSDSEHRDSERRRDFTMNTNTSRTAVKNHRRQPAAGVGRLVRRLERERRSWARRPDRSDAPVVATEVAWRAGVAEGLRLAQAAIRKGV